MTPAALPIYTAPPAAITTAEAHARVQRDRRSARWGDVEPLNADTTTTTPEGF